MTIVKLFTVDDDFSLGFQSVNRAMQNNDDMWDAFGLEHGVPSGIHATEQIARGVANFYIDCSPWFATPRCLPVLKGRIPKIEPTRIETGRWRFKMPNNNLIGAIATCSNTDLSVPYYATTFVDQDAVGQFLIVTTWDASIWTKVDCDFSLAIWAGIPA